ncbi:hypothetical protein [Leifsonia xyli]|nr:hypothetical protein [Leifsonia xyli]
MRDRATTCLELVGAGLVVTAAVLVDPVLGVFIGGITLIGIGWLVGRRG